MSAYMSQGMWRFQVMFVHLHCCLITTVYAMLHRESQSVRRRVPRTFYLFHRTMGAIDASELQNVQLYDNIGPIFILSLVTIPLPCPENRNCAMPDAPTRSKSPPRHRGNADPL